MKKSFKILLIAIIAITSLSCSSKSGERAKTMSLKEEIVKLKLEVTRLKLEQDNIIFCDLDYKHEHLCKYDVNNIK